MQVPALAAERADASSPGEPTAATVSQLTPVVQLSPLQSASMGTPAQLSAIGYEHVAPAELSLAPGQASFSLVGHF